MRSTRRNAAATAVCLAVLSACGSDDAPATTAAVSSSSAPTTIDSPPSVPATSEPAATMAPEPTAPATAPPEPTGPLPIPAVTVTPIATIERATDVAARPGDDRLYALQQAGQIVALEADARDLRVVLDIAEHVGTGGSEQGLLGLAFHPDRDLAYVNYTDSGGDTVIAEFTFDPATGVFDPTSEREVLTVEQPYANHNGGDLAFGPDGYLYIGLGDGGSGGDPQRYSLDLSSRLGKILRIDPTATTDAPFAVPDDNPFVGVDGADPTIWSFGLRNPWRFSFDDPTGELWIADVGQNEVEEINRSVPTDAAGAGRGVSYGWSAYEGIDRFNEDQPGDGHESPVVTYRHDDGNCSVGGGAVYRGTGITDLRGWYVYGDYCSGRIWGYDPTSPAETPVVVELGRLGALSAISPDASGELVVVSNDGAIARLT